jgi:hypothetical protein
LPSSLLRESLKENNRGLLKLSEVPYLPSAAIRPTKKLEELKKTKLPDANLALVFF